RFAPRSLVVRHLRWAEKVTAARSWTNASPAHLEEPDSDLGVVAPPPASGESTGQAREHERNVGVSVGGPHSPTAKEALVGFAFRPLRAPYAARGTRPRRARTRCAPHRRAVLARRVVSAVAADASLDEGVARAVVVAVAGITAERVMLAVCANA